MERPGLFVTLEGPEAVGKSSTLAIVARKLVDAGENPIITKEPGGTPLGLLVRRILLDGAVVPTREAEFLLFQSDRAQHVREVIQPALQAGRIVISDRYILSSIAYQVEGRGLPKDEALPVIQFATGGLIPDFTVLLMVDIEVGFQRLRYRGDENRLDRETRVFHEEIHKAYRGLYGGSFAKEWMIIDTTPSDMTPEAVAQKVVDAILAFRQ